MKGNARNGKFQISVVIFTHLSSFTGLTPDPRDTTNDIGSCNFLGEHISVCPFLYMNNTTMAMNMSSMSTAGACAGVPVHIYGCCEI